MKKLLLAMLVLGLIVTGCARVPKLENGQDAVVTLSNGDISVDALFKEMKERYALNILIDMIDKQILNKEYKDTDEMKEEINAQISSWLAMYGSEEALLEQTQSAWGISTMEDLREYLKIQFKRNKAVEDYVKSLIKEDEINKFYEENIFGDISARHILIKPEINNDMTNDQITVAEAEALKKARELITKLNNGEDFEELAKEHSADEGSASKGGLLNDFAYGVMVKEFEKAARELAKGKYTTNPVKTIHGYHIILKLDQKTKPKLATVKDDIIEEIMKEKLKENASLQVTALEKLREKYKMNIRDRGLKAQYENYLTNAKKNSN